MERDECDVQSDWILWLNSRLLKSHCWGVPASFLSCCFVHEWSGTDFIKSTFSDISSYSAKLDRTEYFLGSNIFNARVLVLRYSCFTFTNWPLGTSPLSFSSLFHVCLWALLLLVIFYTVLNNFVLSAEIWKLRSSWVQIFLLTFFSQKSTRGKARFWFPYCNSGASFMG